MGLLKEGHIYDVTGEARTVVVDGLEVSAYHARPDGMPGAGVVVHPDMGGLRPLFEDMARRLATHGFAVVTLEQFASQPESVRASAEERMAHVVDLEDDQQMEIFSAAADLLVVEDDVPKVSMIGFCMGGHYTLKAAAVDRFDAAVAFYGMVRAPDAWKGPGHTIEPLAVAPQMCPTLAFFGTKDPWTPEADVEALARAWSGRDDCEIVLVEGAEHGFVHDPARAVHRPDDAARAWERTLSWIG